MLPITPFPIGAFEDSHLRTEQRVKELLLQGKTVTQIARELGVSKPTVCFDPVCLSRLLGPVAVQARIRAAGRDQLVVRSLLDDPAAVQHQDPP